MESNKQNYVAQKRKFHDAWAFLLYLIYYIGCNAGLYMLVSQGDIEKTSVNYRLLATLSISTFVLVALSFLAFAYLAEFTLKCTSIIYPIVQIILWIYFPHPVIIILGVFGLIVWGFFLYYYWSKIPIIAKILSSATQICISHAGACITGIILCSTLQIIQVVLTFLVLPNLDQQTSMLVIAAVFLNFFWTIANFNYFFKVYVSSIIVHHFIDKSGETTNVFGCSFSSALYALGSISYAGLVIAVVQTMKLIVSSERNNTRRERNLLASFCLCLIEVILAMLESIIEFANSFSMPYIAIHGCGYVESVKESFKLINTENSVALGGMTLLDCALSIFSLLSMTVTFFVTYYTFSHDINFDPKDKLFILSAINTVIAISIVYYVSMSTFISAYLGVIYLYTEKPILISQVDKELAETLKKQSSYMD